MAFGQVGKDRGIAKRIGVWIKIKSQTACSWIISLFDLLPEFSRGWYMTACLCVFSCQSENGMAQPRPDSRAAAFDCIRHASGALLIGDLSLFGPGYHFYKSVTQSSIHNDKSCALTRKTCQGAASVKKLTVQKKSCCNAPHDTADDQIKDLPGSRLFKEWAQESRAIGQSKEPQERPGHGPGPEPVFPDVAL